MLTMVAEASQWNRYDSCIQRSTFVTADDVQQVITQERLMFAALQVGRHANVVEAARAATAADGGGLFRGTAALLSREVPFYMFGGRSSGAA